MKFFAKMLGFDTETYHDHTGQPSASRKTLAVVVAVMVVLILSVVWVMVPLIAVERLTHLHNYFSTALTALGTVISLAFAAIQAAKAYAQGKSATTSTTTATATPNPSPQPAAQPPSPPPPDTATAKTTTATGNSTKASGGAA